jgi:F420-dependent oxidoreductase-like protein
MSITRFDWPGGPAGFGPRLAEIAVRADEAGVHSLWAMDHFWQIPYHGPETEPMLECYTVLPYLAGITRQVQLGAMVTAVSYRPPGMLLKALTTLDVLSGGRAWLGIGAAWNADEAAGLGLPFPPLRQRYRQLEETLQIAGRMWSGDESAYDGEEFQLARPLNSPGPVRPGGPPILIGGSGEKRTLRLVAQYADACNLFYTGDLDAVQHSLGVLRRHCDEVGRDYDEIVKTVAATVPTGSVSDLERLAEAGIDLVVVELPGTDAAAVEPLAAAAEAVAGYGRPAPSALRAALPRAA